MAVVKIKTEYLLEGYYTGEYELQTYFLSETTKNKLVEHWNRKTFLTNVCLSLKKGKRRHLVNGKIRTMPDWQGQWYDLYFRYFFRPNNPEKMRALIS